MWDIGKIVIIIINIKVVKLPYVNEKPLKIYKYFENINEITFNAIEPKTAPYICPLKLISCFGINLYINKNITNVIIQNTNWVNIDINTL